MPKQKKRIGHSESPHHDATRDPAPLKPPSFKEACAVVADVFEAIPESWTKDALARYPDGLPTVESEPGAVQWCVIGAMLVTCPQVRPWEKLFPFAQKLGYGDDPQMAAVRANNEGGREVAIKMLRMAAGQINA